MEYLAGFAVGIAAGVWLAIIGINLKRQSQGAPSVSLTKAIQKPFTSSKKLKPKVNNDDRAWKLQNNREA